MLLLLALLLNPTARAQDTMDAHGFLLAPNDGDRLDYLSTWRPEAQRQGALAVGGLFEYADSPLVLYYQDQGELARDVLVDNLFGVNVGATYGITERVGVALAAPLWFTSLGPEGVEGIGIGDMRLSVPVGVIVGDGLGVSLVPFADVPTGADARFLGNQGFAVGGLAAVGYRGSGFDVSGNLGAQSAPAIRYENLRGGARLVAALGAGYEVNDWLGLRAEAVARPVFTRNDVEGTESPSEALFSARGRHDGGLSWTAGGATALTRGASAAAFRLFAGVGYTYGADPAVDSDGDGLADPSDTCPDRAETANGFADQDGCPDLLADLRLTVVNEDGQPVDGASVTLGGQTFTASQGAPVELRGQTPGQAVGAVVSHPHYAEAKVDDILLAEGANEAKVVLKYLPGQVRLVTKSQTGAIVDARVTLEGPARVEPRSVGEDGSEVFELRPGDWRILVSAESFGTERREVQVKPGETSLVVIEVTLAPTKAVVKGTEIVILEQVNFDFDKDTILASSLPLLDQVANVLLEHPEIGLVEVQGHTDDKGNDAYNLDLSQRRVESVRRYLVERGVAADRLVAKGYGESVPLVPNTNEKNRAKNRRVQFIIVQTPAREGAG